MQSPMEKLELRVDSVKAGFDIFSNLRDIRTRFNMRIYEWDSLRDKDSLTDMLSSEFEIRNDTPLFLGKIVGTSRTGSKES